MRHLHSAARSAAFALICFAAPAAHALSPVAPPPPPNVAPIRIVGTPASEPVRLERAIVRTEIVGSFAQTRIELVLRNPNDRVLEGELQFPLADTQTLTGFALDIDGDWRPAVPVDKAKGRQVFEDVTRARVDPALLEATQGNVYKLRVYPLPARGTRRVALQLAQTLAVAPGARQRFELPLGFAAQAGELDVQVRIAGVSAGAVRTASRALPGDALQVRSLDGGDALAALNARQVDTHAQFALLLPQAARAAVAMQAVGARTYVVADVPLRDATAPRPAPRRVVLLWDASGSGAARDHTREFALLDAYFKALRQVEVDLIVGRDRVEAPQRFVVAEGRWDALRQALGTLAYDGASDLGALIAAPAAAARPANGERSLALLFSDGIATWGASTAQAAASMPLYAVSASANLDGARLRAFAEPSGGRWIDLLQGSAASSARELQTRRTRLVAMHGDGLHELVGETRFPVDGRLRLAGWMDTRRTTLVLDVERPDGTLAQETIDLDTRRAAAMPAADEARDAWVAQRWAGLRIAELDAQIDLHRAEVRRLGRTYGLATRETSLIVLDNAADYARHEIEPPRALRAEVERLLAAQRGRATASRNAHLDRVAARFAKRVAWWQASYPKDAPPAIAEGPAEGSAEAQLRDALGAAATRRERQDAARDLAQDAAKRAAGNVAAAPAAVASPAPAPFPATAPAPAPAPAPTTATAPLARTFAAREAGDAALRKTAAGDDLAGPTAAIRLAPWASDSPVARRLRDASPATVYRVYLDERTEHTNSTAFFLDAADALAAKGQNELALRVLSNLAEMDLENRHVLRVLAYRLLQAGQPESAIRALREVLRLSPDEPQSNRDLALALMQSGQDQEAAERLWDVVVRPWDARFPDIDQIALAELNALVERAARGGHALNTSAFDTRLLRNLPVDLRITLAWDADNTDIDLWVIDPNGERAYYGHPQTRQGGRMSQDATGGYGPEEFVLRDAKPGRYTVQAQFFGHRQQVLLSATTVMLRLTTGFGRADQKDEMTSLRLNGRSDLVTVGTFEVARR